MLVSRNSCIMYALLAYLSKAQDSSTGGFAGTANDRTSGGYMVNSAEFNMRYLPELNQVEFTVTMLPSSWFGLALGSQGMSSGTDMLTFQRWNDDKDFEFLDQVSVGYQPPMQDERSNLEGHPNNSIELESDGRATIFARRSLDTNDMQDYVIPLDQPFYVGYAINESNSDISYYTKHTLASSVEVILPSNGDPVWGELVIAEPVDNVSSVDAIVDTFENFFSDGAATGATLTAAVALMSAS